MGAMIMYTLIASFAIVTVIYYYTKDRKNNKSKKWIYFTLSYKPKASHVREAF